MCIRSDPATNSENYEFEISRIFEPIRTIFVYLLLLFCQKQSDCLKRIRENLIGIGCWIRWTRQNLFKSQSFCYHCNLPNEKKKLVKLLQFTKMILNTYLENLWKKRDVKRGSQKMRSSALTLVTQCRVFSFFYFFLTVSQVKKNLVGAKNWH